MRLALTPWAIDDGLDEPAAVLVVAGLGLAVSGVVHGLTAPADPSVATLQVFVSLLVPTGVATGGYWLYASDVPIETRWRVVTWASTGIVVACALGAWLQFSAALGGGAAGDPWSQLTTLAAGGSAVGFVTGVSVGQSSDRAPETEPTPSGTDSTTLDGPTSGGAAAHQSATPHGEHVSPAADATSDADRAVPAHAPTTAKRTLDVLGDDRARVALAIVSAGEGSLSVDDLAVAVAERTGDPVDATAIELRHATLPKLERAHAIEWDRYGNTIALPEHAIFQEGVREVAALLDPFEPGSR
ncbi:hypothetical protein ACFO5R_08880 [Halosolutus amylolyticus]|uniref:DUF7344 domain-containing protein n=1 Tax=Halosolutus amylolyticus TaxID=2932267 RepID=A0ABD5PQ66_9EURY|nr:hypothetical protein [Halosolutus amylolyticus]